MSRLERQWWFFLPIGVLSLGCTLALLLGAGIPLPPINASQWLVWLVCQAALFRLLSFVGWLVALRLLPATAMHVV